MKSGNILRELRINKGYSQQELADAVGVTKAAISKYETGQRRINGDYLEKLAIFFQVEPLYLMTGKTSTDFARECEKDREAAMEKERKFWESILLSGPLGKIAALLELLNEDGVEKAIERVEELTQVPKYHC